MLKNKKLKVPLLNLSFYFLTASISFSAFQKISSFFFALFLLATLFLGFKKPENHYVKLFIGISFLFFIIILLRDLYNWQNDPLKSIEKKLPILLSILIITSKIRIDEKKIHQILTSLTLTLFLILLCCYINAVYKSGKVYILDDGKNFYYSNPFSRQSYTILFGSIHASYLSIFILVSIVYLFEAILESMHIYKKLAHVALIIFFVINLTILSSKIPLLLLSIITIYYVFRIFSHWNIKRYIAPAFILIFLMAFFFIQFDKQLKYRFISEKSVSYQYKYEQWTAAIEVIKTNFIFGTGGNNLQQELNKTYTKNNFSLSLAGQLNPHNEYLHTFAAYGIFGFACLCMIFTYSLYFSSNNRIYLWFIIFFMVFNFFESSFARYWGVFFFFVVNAVFIKNYGNNIKRIN